MFSTTRRGFLRLLAAVAALAGVWPRASHAVPSSVEIHQRTRNTLFGAIGAGLRLFRAPLPPPHKSYGRKSTLALPVAARSPARRIDEAVRDWRPAAGFASHGVSLESVARLLFFANGDTGKTDGRPYMLRAAPSAGALYANELYVVAVRVEGLKPGVYYYDVGHHALVMVREGLPGPGLRDALEAPDLYENASFYVVVTGVFDRYRARYGNRGYRYALIDAGHIGENLRLASSSAGLAERAPWRFCDDVVNALLGVDGRTEAALSVHAVGVSGEAQAGPAGRFFVEAATTSRAAIASLDDTTGYHEATKLVAPGAGGAASPRPAPGDAAASTTATTRIVLAEPVAAAALVEEAIAQRRSPAAFARESITAAQLASVARLALPADRYRDGFGVELWIVAHRVRDLTPGLYRFEPIEHALESLKEGDLSSALEDACLGQEKAADAAVGCLMVASLADLAAREGERAYRAQCIEAGEIGERIYLAAESLDMSARNLAAFVDDTLNRLIGLDGRRRAVLHLTMLGIADRRD